MRGDKVRVSYRCYSNLCDTNCSCSWIGKPAGLDNQVSLKQKETWIQVLWKDYPLLSFLNLIEMTIGENFNIKRDRIKKIKENQNYE